MALQIKMALTTKNVKPSCHEIRASLPVTSDLNQNQIPLEIHNGLLGPPSTGTSRNLLVNISITQSLDPP